MFSEEKLDLILRRREEIADRLVGNPDSQTFVALSRELSGLEEVTAAIEAFRAARSEAQGLTRDARRSRDSTPRCARSPRARSKRRRKSSTKPSTALQIALLPKDSADEKSVILEIRAGTGGDEAALFAGDLFRMYAALRRR